MADEGFAAMQKLRLEKDLQELQKQKIFKDKKYPFLKTNINCENFCTSSDW